MNESGASIQAAAAFYKVRAGARGRRPRRRRPRDRQAPGTSRRRSGGPQRAALDRSQGRLAGLPPASGRRRATRPRRPTPGRRLRALAVPAGGRRRSARRDGPPTRSRRSSPRAWKRPSAASTDAGPPATRVSRRGLGFRRARRNHLVPGRPRDLGPRSDTLPAHFRDRHVTRSALPFRRAPGVPLGACWGNGADGADRRPKWADRPSVRWPRRAVPARSHGPRLAHRTRPAGTRPRRLRLPPSSTSCAGTSASRRSPARYRPGRACRSPCCRCCSPPSTRSSGAGCSSSSPRTRTRGMPRRRRGGSRVARDVALLPGRGRGARLGACAPAAPRR